MSPIEKNIQAGAAAISDLLEQLNIVGAGEELEPIAITLSRAVISAVQEEGIAAGQVIESNEQLQQLKLMSVISDEDGITAVRVWGVGAPQAHWVDDNGSEYTPILPATVLSVPSAAVKESGSRGYLLGEDARHYFVNC